jgi:hypothetical protein
MKLLKQAIHQPVNKDKVQLCRRSLKEAGIPTKRRLF